MVSLPLSEALSLSLSWPGAAVGCSGLLRAPSRIYRSLSVTPLCLQVDRVVPDAEAFPGRDCSCTTPPTCMESMQWCVRGVVEHHDVKEKAKVFVRCDLSHDSHLFPCFSDFPPSILSHLSRFSNVFCVQNT